MKSDLYRVLFRMTGYCAVVLGCLAAGGMVVCALQANAGIPFLPKGAICLGVAVTGLVLMIAAFVMMWHFHKCYQSQRELEEEEREVMTNCNEETVTLSE